MITCAACQTENTQGSRFCRMCGVQLDEPQNESLLKMNAKEVESAIREGFQLIHDGKHEEALFVAETILKSDQEHAAALALKAMVHEDRGEIELAVDTYEQIVLSNPDSTLDKIKLLQLQKKLDAQLTPEELEIKSRNWVAILSGVAATLAVVALGVMLALNAQSNQAKADAPNELYAQNGNVERFGEPAAAQPTETPHPTTNTQPTPPPTGNTSGALPSVASRHSPDPFNRQIPPIGGFLDPSRFGLQPEQSNPPLPSVGGGNTRPQPPNDEPTVKPPKEEKPNPGVIKITPSNSTPADPNDPQVSENAYRVGRQRMAAGDYKGAIGAFESSLKGSKNPGLTHQMMGRAYQRVGDKDSARKHLQNALEQYEKAGAVNDAKAVKRELELLDK